MALFMNETWRILIVSSHHGTEVLEELRYISLLIEMQLLTFQFPLPFHYATIVLEELRYIPLSLRMHLLTLYYCIYLKN